MTLTAMYSAWLSQGCLSAAELHVVLDYAMRHCDNKLVKQILQQRSGVDETHIDKIRTSYNVGAIGAWLTSGQCTKKARREFLEAAEDPLVINVLKAGVLSDSSDNGEDLRLLWRRTNVDVRLGILHNVRWYHRAPQSWGKWLLKKRPFGQNPQEEYATFWSLATDAPDFTWEVLQESGDLDLMTHCYPVLTQHSKHSGFQRMIQSALETGSASRETLAKAINALLNSLDEGRKRAITVGAPETDLLLKVAALFPEGNNSYLQPWLERFGTEEETPKSLEDLLALLEEGTLHPALLDMAKAVSYDHQKDPVWMAVATSDALIPHQASALLDSIGRYDHDTAQLILGKRKPSWYRDTFLALWATGYEPSNHVGALRWKIPERMLRPMLTGLIRSNSRNLDRLVKAGISGEALFECLPTSMMASSNTDLMHAAIKYTRSRFYDNIQAWELFETLIDGHAGTYSELVDMALRLSEPAPTSA